MSMRLQLTVASINLLAMSPVIGQMRKHARPAPGCLLKQDHARNIGLLRIALNWQSGVNDNVAPTTSRASDSEQVWALVCLRHSP